MAECLTINGTLRLNLSSIWTNTVLNDYSLIQLTCTDTNVWAIPLDIITADGCASGYTIAEKGVAFN